MEANSKLRNDGDKIVNNTLYKHVVRCWRYTSDSRPNIWHNVGVVIKFMKEPKMSHLQAVKIMRYLKHTIDYGVIFPKLEGQKGKLFDLCDSD